MNKNQIIPVTLNDGIVVEAVYYGSGTLCVSTQAGCAVGCPFCASGSRGFFRNLTVGEIQAQIDAASGVCTAERITLSGIGEPLHNWDVVKDFIQSSDIPVSVTTTGFPLDRFSELLHLPHNGVMLSLHSAIFETHRQLVPKGAELNDLIDLFRSEWELMSRNKKRKIGINYLLVKGINDTDVEVNAMAELMKGFPEATLHLLLCNVVDHSDYQSPPDERVQEIYRFFRNEGMNCRRANSWRRREDGGCGTLMVRATEDNCN